LLAVVEEGVFERIAGVIKGLDGIPKEISEKITADTNIVRDLRLDSIAVMDFIMAVETKFNTIIPIDAMTDIQTVGDLARMLGGKSVQAAH